MRAEMFMNFLFYAMAVAAVLLVVWMVLTRYFGVKLPSICRQPVF